MIPSNSYTLHSIDALKDERDNSDGDQINLQDKASRLEAFLQSFGVLGKITNAEKTPYGSRFDFSIAPGIRVASLLNLKKDIGLYMGGVAVSISQKPNRSIMWILLHESDDVPRKICFDPFGSFCYSYHQRVKILLSLNRSVPMKLFPAAEGIQCSHRGPMKNNKPIREDENVPISYRCHAGIF